MKIFDCFPFFNEIDVLKMRLELHYPYVDKFYICESDRTYNGKNKDYNLKKVIDTDEFSLWRDKIIYIQQRSSIDGLDLSHKDTVMNLDSPAWKLENVQRNGLHACTYEMADDDIAFVTDVDEFINPDFFNMLRTSEASRNFDIARLEMITHFYYMNCRGVAENRLWYLPIIIKGGLWKNTHNISEMRPSAYIPQKFLNVGWHFSYLGGVEQIMKKVDSFSHTEVNRPEINNAENIGNSIAHGLDYIHRPGHEYAFYPVSSYPKCIQDLMYKNQQFVRWYLG
jgi:beta-1,4-mannosyl-glycoprotein beta-1,4-N-acetylglucosaminyltransferase